VPQSSAPRTNISLEFGIDNLVAIGIVHAENRLTPRLEQEVAEIHRLGSEVNTRGAELIDIYGKTEVDPEFEADCTTLIKAAEKLGLRLAVDLTKGDFNPNTLGYRVTARFRGDMHITREYTVEDDRADEIRAEIEVLRAKQTTTSKAAARTKSQLNPGWLEKQMRASIAENAMNESPSGSETVKALLTAIDKAIDTSPVPVSLRQLERD
jgi:hypothetical protein